MNNTHQFIVSICYYYNCIVFSINKLTQIVGGQKLILLYPYYVLYLNLYQNINLLYYILTIQNLKKKYQTHIIYKLIE